MAELKGSKTERNLREAFGGESMARNKYTYFASVARKEGYEQIAAFFMETAENEKEHAKLHFKALQGIGTTADNLRACIEGEHYEWTDMYVRMAKEAREEGFPQIATVFEGIARIEKTHEARFQRLLDNLKQGKVFKRSGKVVWQCRNCGHLHEGTNALAVCPVCQHPLAFFELKAENF